MQGRSSRTGQALIMVTIALVAMSGLVGMAVDFGWSYYVRKTEQAAADAAALAAANAAMDLISSNGPSALSCSSLSCMAETVCGGSVSGTAQSACQYAQSNGFTAGGDNNRQNVTVAAGVNSGSPAPPPTAPGVNVRYWVTVRVSQSVPQLYSAVLGNATANVAARATAAIVDTAMNGSLIALDRTAPDKGPGSSDAIDVKLGHNSSIVTDVRQGIMLPSLDPGAGTCTDATCSVSCHPPLPLLNFTCNTTPLTLVRTSGGSTGGVSGGGSWSNIVSQPDGAPFSDPMRNLGQPPIPSTYSHLVPVPNGDLNAACGTSCLPGVYYATDANGASGKPLTITSNLNFSNGGNWGDYIFYGGLNITNANVNLDPGRYIMAGVLNPASTGNYDLNIGTGASVSGGIAVSDAGRMFILTDSTYPNLPTSQIPGLAALSLSFAPSQIAPGTAPGAGILLAGLDTTNSSVPSELQDYSRMLIWQDQRFSYVKYTSNASGTDGNIDTSCGSLDSPCTQSQSVEPVLTIGAALQSNLNGVVYQPRGAKLKVLANGNLAGAAQLVSGYFDIGDGAVLDLQQPITNAPALTPRTMRVVALVE